MSHFVPLKQIPNTWRLKNKSCNRNEPKHYTSTWQIIGVKLYEATDNSGNHADL